MAAVGRMRRKYAKGMMKKLTEGGDFVSDMERQKMGDAHRGQVASGLNAQAMQLNQMNQALGRGGPQAAHQLAGAQQGIAEGQATGDVAASRAAQEQEAALRAQRGEVAQNLGREIHDINREWARYGLDHLIDKSDKAAQVAIPSYGVAKQAQGSLSDFT